MGATSAWERKTIMLPGTVRIVALGVAVVLIAGSALGGTVKLKDLSSWKSPAGTWLDAAEAFPDPANEKMLATKPGVGVIVNGPDGKTSDLVSTMEFGDMKAHVEFMVPKGSNSGVYFMGRYEVQVFDSHGVTEPKYGDCGGIYQGDDRDGVKGFEGRAPKVNAALPPGQWQRLDVFFRAPRFDANGKKTANAVFEKVILNDQLLHENVEVSGPTRASLFQDEQPKGPLTLQGDHGPVAYRNIIIGVWR